MFVRDKTHFKSQDLCVEAYGTVSYEQRFYQPTCENNDSVHISTFLVEKYFDMKNLSPLSHFRQNDYNLTFDMLLFCLNLLAKKYFQLGRMISFVY